MTLLIRAQLMRALGGRAFAGLIGLAAVLDGVSILGTGRTQAAAVARHTVSAATAEHRLASLGFGSLLFAAIAGVLLATTEFRTGSVALSAILAKGPRRLLGAKLVASLAAGAAFGVVGVLTGGGGAWIWAHEHHLPLVWTAGLVHTLVGVFLVCLLAAPWGVAVGWVGRRQLPTILGLVLWTLAVESAVVSLLPDVGQWLPGGAQAAIYGDLDSRHLGMVAGLVLFCGWTAAAISAGDAVARRRGLL